jgi:preprotein translocase subunit SecG
MDIFLGIILLVAAIFLIVSVLLQSGKTNGMSGVISGGAETFFGKNKGATADKMLSKLTSIVAIVFCLIVIAMYVFQKDTDFSNILIPSTDTSAVTEDTSIDTDSAPADSADNDAE